MKTVKPIKEGDWVKVKALGDKPKKVVAIYRGILKLGAGLYYKESDARKLNDD